LKEVIVLVAFVVSILAANMFPGTPGHPPEPHNVAEAAPSPLDGPG